MYVCMYVCMYVYACMCMYVYVRVCTCMYVYVCVCMCMYVYVCIYVNVCMLIYLFMSVCMGMCVYICMFAQSELQGNQNRNHSASHQCGKGLRDLNVLGRRAPGLGSPQALSRRGAAFVASPMSRQAAVKTPLLAVLLLPGRTTATALGRPTTADTRALEATIFRCLRPQGPHQEPRTPPRPHPRQPPRKHALAELAACRLASCPDEDAIEETEERRVEVHHWSW